MLGAGSFFDTVGVIQQDAEIADAPDAGFGAHRWLPGLNARIAEDAFFRLTALPVKVDFFIWTAADAHPPAAAFVLVYQHDAIFLTLVDGAARAGGHAARVEAVLAQAREIHHEGIFELAVHLFLHGFEVTVAGAFLEFAAEQLLPVRAPVNLIHTLAADQRARAGGRQIFALRRVVQVLVVVGKGFVVIVDRRQHRVGENLR